MIQAQFLNPKEMWAIGREPNRPIKICGNPNSQSFGDFTMSLFFINTIADHFDFRHVTVIFRDDRHFKRDVLRLLAINISIPIPDGQPLPSLDLLNTASPLYHHKLQPWFDAQLHQQDLFISDHMSSSNTLWTFKDLAFLRFPEEDVTSQTEELVKRGLDPDRWFCTVHCREPGYVGKPTASNLRDQDPEVFLGAVGHIINKLGGQVVRLGHPGMTPFPPMPGFIDLCQDALNSYLQIFAISRSRFLLSGPSGPIGVSNALHVPQAQVNGTDYPDINDRCVMRTLDVLTPGGKILAQEALFDAGFCKRALIDVINSGDGYKVYRVSLDETIRLVNFIYDMTCDTLNWRVPDPPRIAPRPNQFTYPGLPVQRGIFLPLKTA